MTDSDDPTLRSSETPSPTEPPPSAPDPKFRVRSSGRVTPRKRARLPVTIRYLLPLLVLLLVGREVFDWWQSSRVVVEFVDRDGNPISIDGEIELLSDSNHPADPAPQQLLLGPLEVHGESFVFDAADVGGTANVRVRSKERGTAFITVEADGESTRLVFGEPVTRGGVVKDGTGRPIEGARVTAIGWAERGVALATATTDSEGRFELSGVSDSQLIWNLQVLASGYVVANVDWPINEVADPGAVPIVLTESRPVPGRLVLPDGLSADGLSVGVLRLPSIDLPVAADGSFVLDHVPTRHGLVRLIVRGLPDGYTHLQTVQPLPATEVELEVLRARRIRGQVVSGHNDKGLPNARVFHPHGPRGEEYVTCDEEGRFELVFVPPIALEIGATFTREAAGDRTTSTESVDVPAGTDDLELKIPFY